MTSTERKGDILDISNYPESIVEIAEVIGLEKALLLVKDLPSTGRRSWRRCIYVPAVLPLEHYLVSVLGWDDALALSRAFAGMILQPSNGKFHERRNRDRRIHEKYAEGLSIHEIATDVELSTYRVQEIIQLQEFESDEYPASFVEVAGLIGLDRATLLFDSFPVSSRGCVYVPSYIEPDHMLAKILGWDDALALVRGFTGKGAASAREDKKQSAMDSAVLQSHASGLKLHQIAAAIRLPVTDVCEIIMRHRPKRGERSP